jgi:hypothetical protein
MGKFHRHELFDGPACPVGLDEIDGPRGGCCDGVGTGDLGVVRDNGASEVEPNRGFRDVRVVNLLFECSFNKMSKGTPGFIKDAVIKSVPYSIASTDARTS